MVAKKGKYTWLGETKMLCFRIKSYRSDDEIQSDRLKMMKMIRKTSRSLKKAKTRRRRKRKYLTPS